MKGYRFPRTLDEAFGPDAASACAVTCYRQSRAPRLLLWTILAAFAVAALLSAI